jgi:hypothetical protein
VLSSLALGQGAKLILPGTGPYQIWYSSGYPGQPAADAQTVAASSADLNPTPGSYLAVVDSKSGNMAALAAGRLHGTVTLKDADFADIAEVRVSVTHNGDAVEAGSVDLTDGRGRHSAVLDPSRAGVVSFYGVKPGDLKVSVHYVSGGKDAAPLVQLVKEEISRPEAVPTIQVAVTADVATMKEKPGAPEVPANPQSAAATSDGSGSGTAGAGTSSGDSATPQPPKTKEPPGPFSILGKLVGMVLGFALIAAVAWALWYFLIKNPKAAAERLTALGVQIPKAPDDPGDLPQIPVAPSAPQPVQKIMLDDSAPTPIAATPYVAPVAAVASSFSDRPRLVKADGEELVVMEGVTTVGREAGLGLSLVDESTVSRRHAEVVRSGSQLVLRDLGSTNGTFVNGRKVSGETALSPGDQVQFGSVKFSVQA